LDDLLVAALHRALALPQVHDVAVRIAEDLDLDVARRFDVLLEQQRVVAERRLRLATRTLERLRELARAAHDAHALAATAGRCLDEQRKPDRARVIDERSLIVAVVAGHDRHARALRDPLGALLAAEAPD